MEEKYNLSEEGILEKVKIDKFLETLTPGTICKYDCFGAFKMVARGIMSSLSEYYRNDPKTLMDVVLMVRAIGFEILGYVDLYTSKGLERIQIRCMIR